MAMCAHCETQETETYENDVPICIACATDKAVERATSLYGTMDGMGTNPPEDSKRDG